MGIMKYMVAKTLGIAKVPVVVKDMNYNEFIQKYKKTDI
jgi:hypothetical protein